MLTIEQVKKYLRIDFEDDNDFIVSLISASKSYLDNAIGNFKESELTKLAQLLLIEHWYENRTLIGKVNNDLSHSIDAIIFQVRYTQGVDNESGRNE